MKNKKFPVGKPKVISRLHIIKHLPITKPDQIFWRGFVSCRILPPKQLKIPLLEMKVGEKRIAALCFSKLNKKFSDDPGYEKNKFQRVPAEDKQGDLNHALTRTEREVTLAALRRQKCKRLYSWDML
ncbi:unnamed protein product [Caenorhabditis brenneri]